MIEIVGVKFRPTGRVYNFLTNQLDLQIGDQCIVETERGFGFGEVDGGKICVDETHLSRPLKNVLRQATPEDLAIVEENHAIEIDAKQFCLKRITARQLDMQLVDVECTFDRNQLTFYFIAEGRIDFRELVRELAAVFRTRIELHQIGVRDEAKILGGIGPCGRTLCCSTFLGDFVPVSIKMAKDQGLSLNPAKISGLCGRLMCCLNYENDTYVSLRKAMPDYGQEVMTPEGKGKVVELNVLSQVVKVRLFEHNKTVEFAGSEL